MALEWYSKAAAADDPRGNMILGSYYLYSHKAPKDIAKGYRLTVKSAEAGNTNAMLGLWLLNRENTLSRIYFCKDEFFKNI